jgi:Glyoxalase-like domain
MVTLMRVNDYTAPSWPEGPQRQQLHLDVAVEELDSSVADAIALGAKEADQQPAPDLWRVLIDPAGHPFCLSTVRPD